MQRPRPVKAKASASCLGTFSKDPETRWLVEHPDRCMELLDEFFFDDSNGKRWSVPAKYKVDGASIPRALWTLVGSPYTDDYRRASIVHDKACDDARGDPAARRAADRMFYCACRTGGCSPAFAWLLYLGVRFGALMPKVAAWRPYRGDDVDDRLSAPPSEQRIQADFRLVAERVLASNPKDDPLEVQRKVDAAIRGVLVLSFADLQ